MWHWETNYGTLDIGFLMHNVSELSKLSIKDKMTWSLWAEWTISVGISEEGEISEVYS